MKKNNCIIPEAILKQLPVKFHIITENETQANTHEVFINSQPIINTYYNTSHLVCVNNYRKTSKLLKHK